jgi:hypothetical protein
MDTAVRTAKFWTNINADLKPYARSHTYTYAL